ncbi:hypothetical protein Taro_005790 [Colocasia esculenta]|uniref:aldehyde oxygenase (deformylating) n=1 Tax=Colocasia esculenta TaxID=4460 RepID=A0A843TP88_COLES|nr:hypothetical protein [Colocasia esculenta]
MACICRASGEVVGTFVPVLVYWVYSGICMALASTGKYRLHPRKEAADKNLVSKRRVLLGVLVQQAFHVALSLYFLKAMRKSRSGAAAGDDAVPTSLLALAGQFLLAMLVLDAWQYFLHRYMHANSFLYRYSHSKHHRLVVPYAFGALYYHTPEGLLLNTIGGFVAVVASGMSIRASIFFFSLVAVKNVDIHCGMWIPWHPLNALFGNNGAYHDLHHQTQGGNYNFSQPFFVFWDRILGTHLPYDVKKREEGGFELRAATEA